jgi:SAM-dependent methyltransferase
MPTLPERIDRVLEIGCGYGTLLEFLAEQGARELIGFEIEKESVDIANKNGMHVELTKDIISSIASIQHKVNAIFMMDVLEHLEIELHSSVLTAARQKLDKDGHFICQVPNANSALAARMMYDDPTHKRLYTERSLSFYLREAGFTDVKFFSSDWKWRPWLNDAYRRRGDYFNWILWKLGRKLRDFQIRAECGPESKNISSELNLLIRAKI